MTRLLFSGGQLLDGTGAGPGPADVVVEDGRILAVGGGLDGDDVVDTTGLTVLPGLFDCHTHVTFSGDLDPMRRALKPFSMRYFDAVRNLAATLDIGITTIREAGGADLGVKQAVESGVVAGPRMQISITMLSQTGGHGDSHLPSGACLRSYDPYPGNPSPIVDGPEEMRRRVRELVREGADVIKVATSGGVLSPRDEPRHGHFRDDELGVLVAEASAAGLFVMAHAQATDGIAAAVRAGIRSIEHGIYLDEATIAMMLERGTWLVPTLLAPASVLAAADAGSNVSEWALRKTREVIAVHRESFGRAVAAGVKVAMGTDSGVGPHGHNLEELSLMVDHSGMSPIEAWTATTSSAAALLGVGDELGTVEPGKRADLVLLDGDPHDLEKLADRIAGVWKDGVRHR
ncbi:MAG: amidohydrolase family protein [Actinobacteria bacterium]|nr:MAG: amidohydrolase family protein [Actinomycetota bacterium]